MKNLKANLVLYEYKPGELKAMQLIDAATLKWELVRVLLIRGLDKYPAPEVCDQACSKVTQSYAVTVAFNSAREEDRKFIDAHNSLPSQFQKLWLVQRVVAAVNPQATQFPVNPEVQASDVLDTKVLDLELTEPVNSEDIPI